MARGGHDSRAIANYFIRLAKERGRSISITQLVKLVYFAHGWNLGLFGKPLSAHPVEAWRYGPVMDPVYDAFKRQESDIRREFPLARTPAFSDTEKAVMDKVYEVYAGYSPYELSRMTHARNGPWDWARKNKRFYQVIPDEVIRRCFKEHVEKRKRDAGQER